MSLKSSNLAALVACLLACGLAVAGEAGTDGEVRLYTNADLERFPSLPSSTVEASTPSEEEWRFVTGYLDRQYERLDKDRAYEMKRRREEAEVELIQRRANRRTYGLPLYWGRFGHFGRVPGRPGGDHTAGRLVRAALPDGSIRPLHAGPTRAQVDRFKATFRSGADAVPRSYAGN